MIEFEYSVIGVDPSLSSTGLACHDGRLETIKTKTEWGDRRLVHLSAGICDELGRIDMDAWPVLAILEDLPVNAMSAGKTGQAQGVIRLALAEAGESALALSIAPATLKKFATGKGNANKAQMRERFQVDTGTDNKDDNQVDAYYLRQYGLAIMASALEIEDDYRLERLKPDGVQAHKERVKTAWHI